MKTILLQLFLFTAILFIGFIVGMFVKELRIGNRINKRIRLFNLHTTINSVRFPLNEDDFRGLVKGQTLVGKNNTGVKVEILLKDIGFMKMLDIIAEEIKASR